VARLGPLAVVDLETTGLPEDSEAEILEFGAVLLDPGRDALVTANQVTHAHNQTKEAAPLPKHA